MSNENTQAPETQTPAARTKVAEATDKVVDNALELGRVWARYGLSIGKMALETSAQSLKTTAGLLGAIADAFEQKDERATNESASAETTVNA